MLRSGDTLTSPATGVRLVFRKTARDTGGAAVVFETYLDPNGYRPLLHLHPNQQQRVQVLAGSVGTQIGGRRAAVGPGTTLTIPAGTRHRLWNAGDEPVQLVVELSPSLSFEALVEALFANEAKDGVHHGTASRYLALAVAAAAHFDTVRLALPPAPLQRLGLPLAACGYRLLARRGA